jgi:RimJ/RimL family protein N-acetyltransferase
MERFEELFRQNLITQRLELRMLEPTLENAEHVWQAIRNENSADFRYVNWTPDSRRPLPENYGLPKSFDETITQMRQEQKYDVNQDGGAVWYVFYNGQMIGHHGVFYSSKWNCMEGGDVWFIKSAWGRGFNREIWSLIIQKAFEELGVDRINRRCFADNERSKKSIISSGFLVDARNPCSSRYVGGGTYKNVLEFTLCREH